MSDLVTDILHVPEELPFGGHAHGGIAEASRFVLERAGPILKTLLKDYQIVIAGHSLGAGAAALMGHSMMVDHSYVMPRAYLSIRIQHQITTTLTYFDSQIRRFRLPRCRTCLPGRG